MIQGGDPQGNGSGGPGYTIGGEFPANGHKQNDTSHLPGVISMARQGSQTNDSAFYNTAGSQFFICVADASFLDGKYAAFGKTTDEQSLQNVIALGKVETDYSDAPVSAQIIASVTVDTHGQTLPELVKAQ